MLTHLRAAREDPLAYRTLIVALKLSLFQHL